MTDLEIIRNRNILYRMVHFLGMAILAAGLLRNITTKGGSHEEEKRRRY